jgi:hypothetical protein
MPMGQYKPFSSSFRIWSNEQAYRRELRAWLGDRKPTERTLKLWLKTIGCDDRNIGSRLARVKRSLESVSVGGANLDYVPKPRRKPTRKVVPIEPMQQRSMHSRRRKPRRL